MLDDVEWNRPRSFLTIAASVEYYRDTLRFDYNAILFASQFPRNAAS